MRRAAFALGLAAAAGTPGCKDRYVEGPDGSIAILLPEERTHADTLQVRITLPREYFWPEGSDEFARGLLLRPIDYTTQTPADDASADLPHLTIVAAVSPRYFADSGLEQFHDRFDDIGEMRFGLSYRPQPVPSRPEDLWKRIYVKPGVSGEDFLISCIPPMSPGAIDPPTECTMELMLAPKQIGSRRAGLSLKASVPAARLEDWRQIEETVVQLFAGRVEWTDAEPS